jgi:tRNA(Ile)-lysidine synthase TilS/MesJ
MPPKLLTDDRRHLVIRPLAYCPEKDIARYARQRQFPIIPCQLCGSQDNLQRVHIKQMLTQWERESPGRIDSIFRSLQNVSASHLADPYCSILGLWRPLRSPRRLQRTPIHRRCRGNWIELFGNEMWGTSHAGFGKWGAIALEYSVVTDVCPPEVWPC